MKAKLPAILLLTVLGGLFTVVIWRTMGALIGILFIIAFGFAVQFSHQLLASSPQLGTKLEIWDAILKTATALLLIVSAGVGLEEYLSQREQLIAQNNQEQQRRINERQQLDAQNQRDQEQRTKEFNSMIYRARLDLYQEATDTLAKFAYAPNLAEAEKADRRFWELFQGKISIVEDIQVKEEMKLAIEFLYQWEKCKDKNPDVRENLFANLSYDFTQACRGSLKTVFPEAFNPLTPGQAENPPIVTSDVINCVCPPIDPKWRKLCADQITPFAPSP